MSYQICCDEIADLPADSRNSALLPPIDFTFVLYIFIHLQREARAGGELA